MMQRDMFFDIMSVTYVTSDQHGAKMKSLLAKLLEASKDVQATNMHRPEGAAKPCKQTICRKKRPNPTKTKNPVF
jgi:hypothetical protein